MEVVKTVDVAPTVARGTAGLLTQIPGAATTVSAQAAASGGIAAGGLMEVYR